MEHKYEVSVVVLNHNGEKVIEKCLKSILGQSAKKLEIIVVDNGSRDKSIEMIKAFSSVKLCLNQCNLGFAGGNWVGIRNASSEYVAFVNNDAILHKNWVRDVLSIIRSDQMIGAVAGKVLKPDGTIDSIGGLIQYPSGRARFNRDHEGGEIEDVAVLPGSAFMIKKGIALKVGFLDMNYFVLYEETDFFWRLRLAGYRCVYSPKALSWHLHAFTFSQEVSWTHFRKYYFYLRNMMWSNLKNLDERHLVPYILFEIAFSIKQAIKLLLPSRDRNVREYIKAYYVAIVTTLLSMRKIVQKRRFIQSIRKVPDNILLKGHCRDKNSFSRLILRFTRLNN